MLTRHAVRLLALAGTLAVALAAGTGTAQERSSAGIGATAQGSFAYTSAAAIATAVSENSSLQLRVQPMSGSSSYLGLLDTGELGFGVNSGPDIAMAYRGQEPFLPNPNLRLIAGIARFDAALIVRADSAYRTLTDAKGARLAGGFPSHLISLLYTNGSLAAHGLTTADFNLVPVANSAASLQALKEGAVDVAFSTIDSGGVKETAAAVGGIRYLPVVPTGSEEGVDAFRQQMPGTVPVLRKSGEVAGIDEDMTVMAWDFYFTTGAMTDADMVYTATKAFWDNIEDVRSVHATIAASLSHDYFLQKNFDVPYHDGAIRLFREVGVWSDAHESRQQELLALVN